MGGKNPPKPPPKINSVEVLEISQIQSKLLFSCASEFYKAHVEIEEAVIAETRGEKRVSEFFDNAYRRFFNLEKLVIEHSNILKECRKKVQGSASWVAYLDSQITLFEKLSSTSKQIIWALDSTSIAVAIEHKKLQDSMFYDAENCAVRELNMKFSDVLLNSLKLHDNFVINENDTSHTRVA